MQNTQPLAWLINSPGTPEEFRFVLLTSETILGRDPECEIHTNDPLVSRRHAAIYNRKSGFEIEDLNSSNGTYLNDKEIKTAALHDGDKIIIGNTVFLFRMESDTDATISQDKPTQDTIGGGIDAKAFPTGTVQCQNCGGMNSNQGQYCSKCGAALPRLPEDFQQAQHVFQKTQLSYHSGDLTWDEYQAALAELAVQDQHGYYWTLGQESGKWYWHDGENWNVRDPPLHLPTGDKSQLPDSTASQVPVQSETKSAKRTSGRRWGVLGLWLFAAVIVLVLGVYTTIELISFNQGQSLSSMDVPAPPGDVSNESSDADNAETMIPTTDPTGSFFVSETGVQIRPYDPARDGSLLSLTGEVEYLEGQSTDQYNFYAGRFDSGESAILNMGWCAIDQPTLEENMALIQLEGAFDGSPIPQEIWTQEDSQEVDMVCRKFRAVAEDLEPGNHVFVWSASYDLLVFDGWETYQPGTYFNEYSIQISEENQEADHFQEITGQWGELDRDEVQVWIEDGELHFDINQPSVTAISHFQDREFGDFTIHTNVQSLNGSPGVYGVIFRHQDDQHYYSFQIYEQGYYSLVKLAGESVDLIPWTESDAISNQGLENEITVTMKGDRISALINNQEILDLRDESYPSGSLSLMAGTPQELDSYEVIFNNISIEAPD